MERETFGLNISSLG